MEKNFNHLPLPMILEGKPRLFGGGGESETTKDNKNHRQEHGRRIRQNTLELSKFWKARKREENHFNEVGIECGVPILLEIDPEANIEFLRGLGFEIICEVRDGYIIVATEEVEFNTFNNKIEDFIKNVSSKCNSPAKVYGLCNDTDRISSILSPKLLQEWDTIEDDNIICVDMGVSCSGGIKLPDKPRRKKDETEEHYNSRLRKWEVKFDSEYIKWDELKMDREDALVKIVDQYDGQVDDIIDDGDDAGIPDSFTARVSITGKCFKDIVLNYPYLFEVVEVKTIELEAGHVNESETNTRVEISIPETNAPIICVIDSGIQEGHKYIKNAIIEDDSISLLPTDKNVSDEVSDGGHGTRVAGTILFQENIPTEGHYELPCWIRNVRVLDDTNVMPKELVPARVIKDVVFKFSKDNVHKSKIYNHSIGANQPCELKHMTAWAAEIDSQSYSNDVLFIQAAGNIPDYIIKSYISAGYNYPEYFKREFSRICDPAQSLQALTVGSISNSDLNEVDIEAMGKKQEPSAFSRSGPGIWDVVKPEVVEYGGTFAMLKNADNNLTTPPEVCLNIIRKSPVGPAFAKDAVGTSFTTPKVTHIASEIERILPDSPTLLYRALIVESARWPEWTNSIGDDRLGDVFRSIGYGIPDLDRATHNDEYRVTLITPEIHTIGVDEANIFSIPIPEELRSIGDDYNIRIDITLSYAAKPRRTRRSTKRYLSTWLDWCCSRKGEDPEIFARRVFETGGSISDDGNFEWMIGDATNRGRIQNFSNKNGTVLKDWTVINSNQLEDKFCIAVRGHRGWGDKFKAKYVLAVSFEAIDQNIPVYEPIRSLIEIEMEGAEVELNVETGI